MRVRKIFGKGFLTPQKTIGHEDVSESSGAGSVLQRSLSLYASSDQRFFGGTFSAKYSSRMVRAFTHVAAGSSAYIRRVADSLLPPDCEIAERVNDFETTAERI